MSTSTDKVLRHPRQYGKLAKLYADLSQDTTYVLQSNGWFPVLREAPPNSVNDPK